MRLIYIGISICLVSCSPKAPVLHEGDLLFQATENSEMSCAISASTRIEARPDFSHVGILLSGDGADSVLEASTERGVVIVPLQEFLNRSAEIDGKPAVVVMRLRDTTGVTKAVERARSYLGLPYDYSYLPDNGKIYCSELIWESYRHQDGTPLFEARPMNFRADDRSMPQFWIDLFEQLGETIPEGVPGTNPNDLAQDSQLMEIYRHF